MTMQDTSQGNADDNAAVHPGGHGSLKGKGDRRLITTLFFDVDDTLYDVSTGFTGHRNGEGAQRFMMEYLDFPSMEAAKAVRDEYFERYHATAKALMVAEREGKFPPPRHPGATKSPRFDTAELAEFWATNLNFDLLGGRKAKLISDLRDCKLTMIAFSNGPGKYVRRVLHQLGMFDIDGDERSDSDDHIFSEETVFAVDDVLPYCKPEKEAFQLIFDKVGIGSPEECVMIEDSMKNIRRAKELGMKTVLITGAGKMRPAAGRSDASAGSNTDEAAAAAAAVAASEATKPGDAPVIDDPAVDIAIETVEELRAALPGLWETPAMF